MDASPVSPPRRRHARALAASKPGARDVTRTTTSSLSLVPPGLLGSWCCSSPGSSSGGAGTGPSSLSLSLSLSLQKRFCCGRTIVQEFDLLPSLISHASIYTSFLPLGQPTLLGGAGVLATLLKNLVPRFFFAKFIEHCYIISEGISKSKFLQ